MNGTSSLWNKSFLFGQHFGNDMQAFAVMHSGVVTLDHNRDIKKQNSFVTVSSAKAQKQMSREQII